MKKIAQISSILLLTMMLPLGTVKADLLIPFKIKPLKKNSFVVQVTSIDYKSTCYLKDGNNHILYQENIETGQPYERSFNLIELPDGKYEMVIDDVFKTRITHINKIQGVVIANDEIIETTYKPQVIMKEERLTVSLLALKKESLNIELYDANDVLIFKDTLSGSQNLGKKFDLSQLTAGVYKISLITPKNAYLEYITLN